MLVHNLVCYRDEVELWKNLHILVVVAVWF